MQTFRKVIAFLNKLKEIDSWGDKEETVTDEKKTYTDRVTTQNPYGLIGMVLGAVAFVFGPKYGFLPVLSLLFCILTLFTFDKEKEDNPFPFYVGIILSIIGLLMFISGEGHHLIL